MAQIEVERGSARRIVRKIAQKVYRGSDRLEKQLSGYFEHLRSLGYDPSKIRVEVDPGVGAYVRTVGRSLWPPGVGKKLVAWTLTPLSFGTYPFLSGISPHLNLALGGPHYSPFLNYIALRSNWVRSPGPVALHEIGHQLATYQGLAGGARGRYLSIIPNELEADYLALTTAKNPKSAKRLKQALQLYLSTYLANFKAYRKPRLSLLAHRLRDVKGSNPSLRGFFAMTLKDPRNLNDKDRAEIVKTYRGMVKWQQDMLDKIKKRGRPKSLTARLHLLRATPFYSFAGKILDALPQQDVFEPPKK